MTKKTKNVYICDWCKHEFVHEAVFKPQHNDGKALSTQVKCPKCQNFIPTWNFIWQEGHKIHLNRR